MLKVKMSKYMGILLFVSFMFNLYFVSSFIYASPPTVVLDVVATQEDMVSSDSIFLEEPIIAPVLSEREIIDSYILEISDLYDVDKYLIHSIIFFESTYNPEAINKSSGCVGLMQICTKWHIQRAERLGVEDFSDAYSNILIGVDYISELLTKHKNESLVLMLYSGTHKRAFELHKQGETTNYVKKVLKRANELRQRE